MPTELAVRLAEATGHPRAAELRHQFELEQRQQAMEASQLIRGNLATQRAATGRDVAPAIKMREAEDLATSGVLAPDAGTAQQETGVLDAFGRSFTDPGLSMVKPFMDREAVERAQQESAIASEATPAWVNATGGGIGIALQLASALAAAPVVAGVRGTAAAIQGLNATQTAARVAAPSLLRMAAQAPLALPAATGAADRVANADTDGVYEGTADLLAKQVQAAALGGGGFGAMMGGAQLGGKLMAPVVEKLAPAGAGFARSALAEVAQAPAQLAAMKAMQAPVEAIAAPEEGAVEQLFDPATLGEELLMFAGSNLLGPAQMRGMQNRGIRQAREAAIPIEQAANAARMLPPPAEPVAGKVADLADTVERHDIAAQEYGDLPPQAVAAERARIASLEGQKRADAQRLADVEAQRAEELRNAEARRALRPVLDEQQGIAAERERMAREKRALDIDKTVQRELEATRTAEEAAREEGDAATEASARELEARLEAEAQARTERGGRNDIAKIELEDMRARLGDMEQSLAARGTVAEHARTVRERVENEILGARGREDGGQMVLDATGTPRPVDRSVLRANKREIAERVRQEVETFKAQSAREREQIAQVKQAIREKHAAIKAEDEALAAEARQRKQAEAAQRRAVPVEPAAVRNRAQDATIPPEPPKPSPSERIKAIFEAHKSGKLSADEARAAVARVKAEQAPPAAPAKPAEAPAQAPKAATPAATPPVAGKPAVEAAKPAAEGEKYETRDAEGNLVPPPEDAPVFVKIAYEKAVQEQERERGERAKGGTATAKAGEAASKAAYDTLRAQTEAAKAKAAAKTATADEMREGVSTAKARVAEARKREQLAVTRYEAMAGDELAAEAVPEAMLAKEQAVSERRRAEADLAELEAASAAAKRSATEADIAAKREAHRAEATRLKAATEAAIKRDFTPDVGKDTTVEITDTGVVVRNAKLGVEVPIDLMDQKDLDALMASMPGRLAESLIANNPDWQAVWRAKMGGEPPADGVALSKHPDLAQFVRKGGFVPVAFRQESYIKVSRQEARKRTVDAIADAIREELNHESIRSMERNAPEKFATLTKASEAMGHGSDVEGVWQMFKGWIDGGAIDAMSVRKMKDKLDAVEQAQVTGVFKWLKAIGNAVAKLFRRKPGVKNEPSYVPIFTEVAKGEHLGKRTVKEGDFATRRSEDESSSPPPSLRERLDDTRIGRAITRTTDTAISAGKDVVEGAIGAARAIGERVAKSKILQPSEATEIARVQARAERLKREDPEAYAKLDEPSKIDFAIRTAGGRGIIDPGTELYHATTKAGDEGIKAHGGISGRAPRKLRSGLINERGLVYLTPDVRAAKEWAEGLEIIDPRLAGERGVIYRFAPDKPMRLIDRDMRLSRHEIDAVMKALKIPDYKPLKPGDSLSTAVDWRMPESAAKTEIVEGRTPGEKQPMNDGWVRAIRAIDPDAVGLYRSDEKGKVYEVAIISDKLEAERTDFATRRRRGDEEESDNEEDMGGEEIDPADSRGVKLANPIQQGGGRDFFRGIINAVHASPERKSVEELVGEAQRILESDTGESRLRAKFRNGTTVASAAETLAYRALMNADASKVFSKVPTIAEMQEITKQISEWQHMGTEQARAMAVRRDPLNTPEERVAEIGRWFVNPTKELSDRMEAARTSGNEREMARLTSIQAKIAQKTLHQFQRTFGGELTDFAVVKDRMQYARLHAIIERMRSEAAREVGKTEKLDQKFMDKLYGFGSWANSVNAEWVRSALLSGPTTFIKNAASNAGNFFYKTHLQQPLMEAIAGHNPLRPVAEFYKAAMPGIAEGWMNAINAFKYERDLFEMAIFNEPGTYASGREDYRAPQGGAARKLLRTPLRAMSAADAFFKAFYARTNVALQAYRLAHEGGAKPTPEKIKAFVDAQMRDLGSESWQRAYADAATVTFQELTARYADANDTGSIKTLADAIIKVRDAGGPIGMLAVPFVMTPMAIIRQAMLRSPVGFGRMGYRAIQNRKFVSSQGKEGRQYGKVQMRRDAVDALLGSALMALVAGLAYDEKGDKVITGSPANWKGERGKRDAELSGSAPQPMSVRVNGNYVNYGTMEPFSTLLQMGSDAAEMHRKGQSPTKLISKGVDMFASKSSLTSFGDIYRAVTGENDSGLASYIAGRMTMYEPRIITQPLMLARDEIMPARPKNPDEPLAPGEEEGTGSKILRVARDRTPGVTKAFPRLDLGGDEVPAYTTADTSLGVALATAGFRTSVPDDQKWKKLIYTRNERLPDSESEWWPTGWNDSTTTKDGELVMTAKERYDFHRKYGAMLKVAATKIVTDSMLADPTGEVAKRGVERIKSVKDRLSTAMMAEFRRSRRAAAASP